MSDLKPPPKAYSEFIERYPELGSAWQSVRSAGASGPLDTKGQRLIKLGIALGAMSRGSVTSATRKARAAGASAAEIRQVVALGAGSLSLPACVAVSGWVESVLEG